MDLTSKISSPVPKKSGNNATKKHKRPHQTKYVIDTEVATLSKGMMTDEAFSGWLKTPLIDDECNANDCKFSRKMNYNRNAVQMIVNSLAR